MSSLLSLLIVTAVGPATRTQASTAQEDAPCRAELLQRIEPGSDFRSWAAIRLGSCVSAASAALVQAMAADDWAVRRNAAGALGEFGPATAAAIPALVGALDDREDNVSITVRHALVKIGLPAVPALLEVLRGGDLEGEDRPERWHSATIVLRDIGPAVVPLLIGGLSGNDNEAHGVAATLAMIGTSGRAAIPQLIACLVPSRNSLVRERAAAALSAMAPLPAEAVGPLVLTIEDRWARAQAAKALGSMGPEAASGIPALERALARARLDGDKDGERLLIEALGKIRPDR